MGIFNDANKMGGELKKKQEAERLAKAIKNSKRDPIAEQKRHQEAKEQGMI